MKKKIAAILLLSVLVGCGRTERMSGNQTSWKDESLKDIQLNVLVATPQEAEVFRPFEEATSCTVKTVVSPNLKDGTAVLPDASLEGIDFIYSMSEEMAIDLQARDRLRTKEEIDPAGELKHWSERGSWIPVRKELYSIFVNEAVAKERKISPPESYGDLAMKEYEGLIGALHPLRGGFPFLGIFYGSAVDGDLEQTLALYGNCEFQTDQTAVLQSLLNGRIYAAFLPLNDIVYSATKEEDLRMLVPEEGVLYEWKVSAVPADAKNGKAVSTLLQYLVSLDGQSQIAQVHGCDRVQLIRADARGHDFGLAEITLNPIEYEKWEGKREEILQSLIH